MRFVSGSLSHCMFYSTCLLLLIMNGDICYHTLIKVEINTIKKSSTKVDSVFFPANSHRFLILNPFGCFSSHRFSLADHHIAVVTCKPENILPRNQRVIQYIYIEYLFAGAAFADGHVQDSGLCGWWYALEAENEDDQSHIIFQVITFTYQNGKWTSFTSLNNWLSSVSGETTLSGSALSSSGRIGMIWQCCSQDAMITRLNWITHCY